MKSGLTANGGIRARYLCNAATITPVFNPAESTTFDVDGPGPGTVGTPASYTQTSGAVFDSQPRTISNLIVDLNNEQYEIRRSS